MPPERRFPRLALSTAVHGVRVIDRRTQKCVMIVGGSPTIGELHRIHSGPKQGAGRGLLEFCRAHTFEAVRAR